MPISDIGRLRQKRGQINLQHPEKYLPWLFTRDCHRGEGTRHLLPDIYNENRVLHLMSDLEKQIYYMLRTRDEIVEIFEQYPLLPISATEEICNRYNIVHPAYPRNNHVVMTTDLLLIVKSNNNEMTYVACAVKPSSKFRRERVKEKLFVEEMYWKDRNIKFGVMTELDVDKQYVKNVILCKKGFKGVGNRSAYDCIKFLIVNHIIKVNMKKKIDLDKVIYDIKRGALLIDQKLLNEKRPINDQWGEVVDISEIRNILANYQVKY
ncbi:MAG: TnsA endonuclease N-terminal domain-containing protein [Mobilitalea sp.]